MKSTIYLMVPWAVMFLAVSFWFKPVTANDVAEDAINRSFTVEANGLLVINSNLGSIDVVSGDANQVEIEVSRRVETGGGKSADAILRSVRVEFLQSGNTITVNADAPRIVRVDLGFRVRIPRAFNLNLRTSGGGIRVRGASGEIQCKTSGGGLEFENIQGTIKGECGGGGIRLANISGTVRARASGGSINVTQASGNMEMTSSGGGISVDQFTGAVHASSSGGGVSARFAGEPTGDCRLSSSGGDVTVFLPDGTGFSLDSEVRGGQVETEFTLSAIGAMSKHSVKGDVNGGGPKLYCKASGGNIILKKL